MPVAGQVRLRAHQFGRQAAVGTPVAAHRRYPFSGTPDVDLQWTDPEGDSGSLDPVPPPTRGAGTFTAGLTASTVYYNDLPLMLSGIFGQGVTPSRWTWTYTPTSLTPGAFDYFTYQFGDDVTTDYFQLFDGNLTQLVINSPETGGGAVSASMTWRFGQARSTGSTDARRLAPFQRLACQSTSPERPSISRTARYSSTPRPVRSAARRSSMESITSL
jgi:hypothetical protein